VVAFARGELAAEVVKGHKKKIPLISQKRSELGGEEEGGALAVFQGLKADRDNEKSRR